VPACPLILLTHHAPYMEAFTIPLKITTVTPLHIGDDKGEVLSPYCDYVFKDNESLYYLNLRRIEEKVVKANALDEYVRLVRAMDNTRSEFDLKRFLTDRLKLRLEDVVSHTIRQKGLKEKQKLQIMRTVRNGYQPYLPGSSLKGAIRTAILYDWLVCTESGEPVLKDYSKKLLAIEKESDRKKKEDEKRRFFDESKLWGSLSTGSDARFLRVRDSQPLSAETLMVCGLRRIRLVQGKSKADIPQAVEAIKPGAILHTEISIVPEFKHAYFEYLKKKDDVESMLNNWTSFSKDCIKYECEELQDALNNKHSPEEIENLLTFYEGLSERAENGEHFLRLGFGKTVHDNSLILSWLNGLEEAEGEKSWKLFLEIFHKGRRNRDFYPVTRTVTSDYKPMGWVKIELDE